MIATGTVFGPYRVIEKIGAGGMGDVYRALDTRLERDVALKLISDSFLASEAGAGSPSPAGTPHSRVHLSHERFLREARAAATLNHPNICGIHDVGEQDGQPYLVMELLRGETLKQYLPHQKLSPARGAYAGAAGRECPGCGARPGHFASRHQAGQSVRGGERPVPQAAQDP